MITRENSLLHRPLLPAIIIYFLFCLTFPVRAIVPADYFQQKLAYTIHVQLDDRLHQLNGRIEINYTNSSPVALKEIYFHLWPNAYKDNTTPLAAELLSYNNTILLNATEEQRGFIDQLNFTVDNEAVHFKLLADTPDAGKIILNKVLEPGMSICIQSPFRVKLPSARISRLGHLGQAYYISQWYPKLAVFDREGWHVFSYRDKGEYYGEFATYDVFITLPANYVVAATGELKDNESEITWLENIAERTRNTGDFGSDLQFPPSDTAMKTLHYHQDRVHDFAWFADKRYHVLYEDFQLNHSAKKIRAWAFFTNAEANYWTKVPAYIKDAILYHSNWIGDYPFSQMTAADITYGSGDAMEYPMITALGTYGDAFDMEVTTVHEVGHNWFYGILGSNERRFPWMDEGITNFYETRYFYTKYANDSARQEETFSKLGRAAKFFNLETFNHRERQYWSYLTQARKNSDQAAGLRSEDYSRINYGAMVYRKTTLSIDYLLYYLGDSLFDRCMQHYYHEWKFKHPGPGDFKNSLEACSGKDLSWFFDGLINSSEKLDYRLQKVKALSGDQQGEWQITIENKAGINGPVPIFGLDKGNPVLRKWLDGFSGIQEIRLKCDSCDEFRIDYDQRLPELYRHNNSIRSSGLFPNIEKLQFKLGAGLEDARCTPISFLPVAGWNSSNGIMAGVLFHNVFFPQKKFEYSLMPMYGFDSKDLAGGGDIRYHFSPQSGFIQQITLKTGISRYAFSDAFFPSNSRDTDVDNILHYVRWDNRIGFKLKPVNPSEKIEQSIEFRYVHVEKELPITTPKKGRYNYFLSTYFRENKNPLFASSQRFELIGNDILLKASITSRNFFHYGNDIKGFRLRMFAGYHSVKETGNADLAFAFNKMKLSGQTGAEDFLFDEVFPGRGTIDGFWSQQYVQTDGGFHHPTLFYRKADKWMVGLNASTTLPGFIPFRLYMSIGTFNDAKQESQDADGISWEAGVEWPVIKDIFTVYLPITQSKDLNYIIDRENLHYGERIRFEINFHKLNPLEWLRKIEF